MLGAQVCFGRPADRSIYGAVANVRPWTRQPLGALGPPRALTGGGQTAGSAEV